MSTPRSSAFFRVLRASLFVIVLGSLGCTGIPQQLTELIPATSAEFTGEITLEPRGPGALYATPQQAAMDALAWCFLESRARPLDNRRARGGSVHVVEGGYSYATPELENDASGLLAYRMGPRDVAHFRHYPVRRSAMRGFRSVDREAHRLVDQVDPVSRPFYFLTPERGLHVYEGALDGVRAIAQVRLGTLRGDTSLAMSVPESFEPEQPLALDDTRR